MAFIRIERRDDTAVIFFNRPPANAFDLAFMEELEGHLEALSKDVPPGGVVVTGEGRVFSTGVDFKAVPGYSPEQRGRMVGHINACVTALYGLPTATVAAVNGHAVGGAFVMMLACDARLATGADTKLGLPEVTAGIPYPACAMEVVIAETEPAYRRYLVLSGALIDVRTAQTRNLIGDIVAADALLPRAVQLARTRAAAPAYARVKAQLKGTTLARMREIIATGSDPMLVNWI